MWSFFSRDASKDFGYELGSEIKFASEYSLWKLYNGKKKGSNEPYSIFVFEPSADSQTLMDVAKSALKRLKTLRHPSILTYVDSLETDKLLYVVVEPAQPLEASEMNPPNEMLTSWGLHQVASGLAFLNDDCNLCHHNMCLSSIFVDRGGEWKMFGLEYVTPSDQPYPVKVLKALKVYDPPEVEQRSSGSASDSWGYGCLMWEVFNGRLTRTQALKDPGKIPSDLQPLYCDLVRAQAKSRLGLKKFLEKTSAKGYLRNKFVDSMLFLREIHIKSSAEMATFLKSLPQSLESFPKEASQHRILPQLIRAFEFSDASTADILTPILQLGKCLEEEDYQSQIVPCIVKMFSKKDRATRSKLLQQTEEFAEHVSPSVINSQIFPQIAEGFADTHPTIRDNTVKCMLHLAPKLNHTNLNQEMLKHFARLQVKDPEGGIRTNTTVCLGKIASYLHPETRQKVLLSAFVRAMRDPFPPVRSAAILALSATEHFYSVRDCACKVLPALAPATVDPEQSIREQAFKAISGFLSKLEKVSRDPSLLQKMEEDLQSTNTPASLAATWTTWAVTSLTDKFIKTKPIKSAPANDTTPSEKPGREKIVEEKEEEAKIDDSWDNKWEDAEEDVQDTSRLQELSEPVKEGWDDEWEDFSLNAEPKGVFPDDQSDLFQPTTNPTQQTNWDSGDWESWDNQPANTNTRSEILQSKKESNRLAREEKRQQRLKARANKLGAQKIS